MHKSRPTQNKRARERARQEKQQHKAERRQVAKQRKASTPTAGGGGGGGEDPDIAGIVPGPQPNPWGDELEEDESDGAEP